MDPMNIELTGVVRDGAGAVPVAQRIAWPRGEDGNIDVTIQHADGTAFDLTGCLVTFALRPKGTIGAAAGLPLVARQATPVGAAADGKARFVLVAGDTVELAERKIYRADFQLKDGSNKRWQIIPESDFFLGPIVSFPDDPSSAP